jgi:hypothetical protein
MVLDYVLHLRDDRKLSRSSIKVYVAALSLFFFAIRDDDTRLNWSKIKDECPPNGNIRRDRACTVDEILKIIAKGSIFDWYLKAILQLSDAHFPGIFAQMPLSSFEVLI